MIGQAISRRDGPLKVTGAARYSYERQEAGPAAVGIMVGATIAKGRITRIDVAKAERAPGVALVLTHRNVPAQGPRNGSYPDQFGRPWPFLMGDRVEFFGQPVALVVAGSFEQARAAAALVIVSYAAEPGAYDLAAHKDGAYAPAAASADHADVGEVARTSRAYVPKSANIGETDSRFGDIERAMVEGPVTLDQTYMTPHHFAQPMEPAACLASWSGDELTVRVSVQIVVAARMLLARTLQIPPERVHVDAAFVGGGFGAKLRVHEEAVLAALAARELRRPVKVAHTRRQAFTVPGHRPQMIHRVRLASTREGRLTGIGHDVNMQGAEREPFVEQAATVMRSLYAAPNRLTRHRVTNLDLNIAEAVRGPGELPALLAIESAMDQLAFDLDLDPIELRVRNEPTMDPEKGVPFSQRRLVECMREGAARLVGPSARGSRPRGAMGACSSATAWRRRSACTSRGRRRPRSAWTRAGASSCGRT